MKAEASRWKASPRREYIFIQLVFFSQPEKKKFASIKLRARLDREQREQRNFHSFSIDQEEEREREKNRDTHAEKKIDVANYNYISIKGL